VAVNSTVIEASRSATFAVLADGWLYSNWVVGTSHMRAVEAQWPAVGSRLFHASGVWPMVTRDETEVVAVEADRRLELIARGRPLGTAEILIELADRDGGCLVTMTEKPASGPGRWLHNALTEAMLARRNVEALARLAAVVERRTEPSE
jgi:hypothetical protein